MNSTNNSHQGATVPSSITSSNNEGSTKQHKDPPGNYPTITYGDLRELPASLRYSSKQQMAAMMIEQAPPTATGLGNNDNNNDADGENDDNNNGTASSYGCCYACLTKMGCGCLARMPYTWPRFYSFAVGIVVPLWALIALSVVCGYGIARLEGPAEIHANDQISANTAVSDAMSDLANNLTAHIPRICQLLYLRNTTFTEIAQPILDELNEDDHEHAMTVLIDYLEDSVAYEGRNHSEFQSNTSLAGVDQKELYNYMLQCGYDASPLLELLSRELLYFARLVGESGGHTLHWNQCVDTRHYQISILENLTAVRPDIQLANFQNEYDRNREELFEQYHADNIQNGTLGPVAAETDAFIRSAQDASGAGACKTNVDSAAWFWFTIETTVGYGNQSVNTREGKFMVYTLGFFCILAFAGILASAGYVALTIVDVFFEQHNLRVDAETYERYGPVRECFFWGVVYYMWMLAVAAYTKSWKESRLGTPFSLSDGYWFAFISTTTVGFGDIYLEPEVIVGKDIMVWPLLFLVGFVFLSAFLGKFADLLTKLVPGGFQQDELRDRLLGNVTPPGDDDPPQKKTQTTADDNNNNNNGA